MRGQQLGRGMRPVAVAVVLAVVLNLTLAVPAVGLTDLALGNCDATHSPAAYSTYVIGNACDGNDTGDLYIINASNASGTTCMVVDLGASTSVSSWSFIYDVRGHASANAYLKAWTAGGAPPSSPAWDCNYSVTGTFPAGWSAESSVTMDSTTGSMAASCMGASNCYSSGVMPFAGVSARYWSIWVPSGGGYCGSCFETMSLYAGPPSVPIATYISNLTLTHSAPAWIIDWDWVLGGPGVVAGLTASYTTGVDTTGVVVVNPSAGQHSTASFYCGLSCSSDTLLPPFTLHVVDSTRNQEAFYTITSTTGVQIGNTNAPHIDYVQGCATGATGCPTGEAQPGHLVFRLKPMGTDTAGVVVCQTAPTSDGCLAAGTSYTVGSAAGDTLYDSGVITVNTGHYRITATNVAGSDSASFDVTSTGVGGTPGSTQTGNCDFTDVGCQLGAAAATIVAGIRDALAFLFVPTSKTYDAFTAMQAAFIAHEPFATFAAAKAKLDGLLAHSVDSSTSCLSVGLHMAPLHSSESTPLQVCFSALTSYSGWSTIRTLEGVAVYGWGVMFIWDWVRGRRGDEGPTSDEMFGKAYGS